MSDKIKEILLKISDNQQKKENNLNLVFASKKQKIIASGNAREKIKKICYKIKIAHINPHMFRHTFATRMLESNVNIKVLSEILGHKNIQITLDTYAHVLPDTKKENIKKIDNFL